jgi:DNA mismatch endonuclease (patch repair protein)
MSRIKGKNTGLEKTIRSELHRKGLRFRKHVKKLLGTPDIVFRKAKVVVFIDGDFWHGYRFNGWKQRVSNFWQKKISGNVLRDKRNHKRLKNEGWSVIRFWQNEIERDHKACIKKIEAVLQENLK